MPKMQRSRKFSVIPLRPASVALYIVSLIPTRHRRNDAIQRFHIAFNNPAYSIQKHITGVQKLDAIEEMKHRGTVYITHRRHTRLMKKEIKIQEYKCNEKNVLASGDGAFMTTTFALLNEDFGSVWLQASLSADFHYIEAIHQSRQRGLARDV